MANVLVAAHSYTLVNPNGKEKATIRRGQSIDNLPENDQAYLKTKSVTPPMVDDSHPAVGRMPLFHPVLDADVKGEAVIEKLAVAPSPDQPYAAQVTREQVTVSVAPVAPAAPEPAAQAPAAPAAPEAPAAQAPPAPPVPPRPARPAE